MTERRTIRVDYLARVEGEASLTIRLDGDRATDVRLEIFEPPRLFEAFLRGRAARETPDLTSRICGICPIAYMMSACHAVEDGLGVRVTGALRALRRLIYAGEWIESHALHAFLLHAPDLVGCADAFELAREHGAWIRKGLRIKQAGNAILALLGGREIHPINVRIGGFYRTPSRAQLAALLPELRWAREASAECARWIHGFPFPAFERDYELVALRHPDEYPFCEGRVVSSRGLDAAARELDAHILEEQVPYSNALQARLAGRGPYLCGPLARFHLNFERLSPAIQGLARSLGLGPPCPNPFKLILIRLVEIAHACEEAIRIIEAYTPPPAPHVEVPLRAATGYGATEAPRGLLYHRYTFDGAGTILDARIVPPTSQNQRSIEDDLRALAPELARRPHAEATRLAERAIRNHDPCISCATHTLRLRVERGEPGPSA